MILTAPLTTPRPSPEPLNHYLHFGKGLRGLYPIIPNTLEPFGQRVLHHPADKRGDRDGFVLHPRTRSASENLILASTAARGVPCRHGNTAMLPHEVWERTPPEAQAYIQALEACLETLASKVHALQEQVRTLQEQLHQTSQNSSRPPSSDPPQHGRPRRPRSHRRRGGQPGHPGHTRTLIPVEEVDEVVVIKPEQCAHCQASLSGDDPQPWRHQVIEIPPIKPVVTEYQWQHLRCSACGEVTRAPWPDGVPSGTYGPRVQATVALCTGSYRLSKRTTQQMMDEVCGVPMSVGTISQLEQATTEVLAAPVEEARTYVHAQAVAHLDETSWRQGGQRAWLWAAVTSWVTVFVVRMSRGGDVARELLGETFAGILVTDRYSAYNWYPVRWRQLCWAHLLRDFEAMRGRGGRAEEIGDALLAQAHQMFTWWHRVREGTLNARLFAPI